MAHTHLYNSPELYARSVGYKDIPQECESLLKIFAEVNSGRPRKTLELFAGPALNSKYFAAKGIEAHCIDTNPNMKKFALKEKPGNLHYHLKPVTDFKVDAKIDLAFSLMDSVVYLLTNEDFVRHLQMVERALRPGGIYVIEMGHPRHYFSNTGWIQEHVDPARSERIGSLVSFWGDIYDQIDPINMILDCTVHVETEIDGKKIELTESALQRIYLFNEVKLLVEKTKRLEIVKWFGGLSPLYPFDNSPASWRMIPVLRKK